MCDKQNADHFVNILTAHWLQHSLETMNFSYIANIKGVDENISLRAAKISHSRSSKFILRYIKIKHKYTT